MWHGWSSVNTERKIARGTRSPCLEERLGIPTLARSCPRTTTLLRTKVDLANLNEKWKKNTMLGYFRSSHACPSSSKRLPKEADEPHRSKRSSGEKKEFLHTRHDATCILPLGYSLMPNTLKKKKSHTENVARQRLSSRW